MVSGERDVMSRWIRKLLLIWRLGYGQVRPRSLVQLMKFMVSRYCWRRPCPGAVILGITYACQAACSYCSVGKYRIDRHSELSTDEMRQLIRKLAGLGVFKLNLFGGEPLERNDVMVLAEYASRQGMIVFLDTNGKLLNDQVAGDLKRAGVGNVNINLTSDLDACCLNGSVDIERLFQGANLAVTSCVRAGLACVISVFVNQQMADERLLQKVISWARSMGAKGVRLLMPMCTGRLEDQASQLTQDEVRLVERFIDDGFVYHESVLFGINAGRRCCEASQKSTVFISPYGDVQLCYTVPASFGNVRQEPVDSIISRMWGHRLFQSAPGNECAMNSLEFRRSLAHAFHAREDGVWPVKGSDDASRS